LTANSLCRCDGPSRLDALVRSVTTWLNGVLTRAATPSRLQSPPNKGPTVGQASDLPPYPKWYTVTRTEILIHRRTQDFTIEGVHVVAGRARGSGGWKSPSGVQGQSLGRGSGEQSPLKRKQNVKLAYNFYRFPVQNLGFDEYRSRAWTVAYSLQTYNSKPILLKF